LGRLLALHMELSIWIFNQLQVSGLVCEIKKTFYRILCQSSNWNWKKKKKKIVRSMCKNCQTQTNCKENWTPKGPCIQKVDAPWATLIITSKITNFGIWCKLRKWSFTSFVSIPFQNFEKCQKIERLIAIESSMC